MPDEDNNETPEATNLGDGEADFSNLTNTPEDLPDEPTISEAAPETVEPIADVVPPTSGYAVNLYDYDAGAANSLGIFYTLEEAIAAADAQDLDEGQVVRVVPISYFRVG